MNAFQNSLGSSHWKACWNKLGLWLGLFVGFSSSIAAAQRDTSDELFTNGSVRQLQIELTPEGVQLLKNYRQVWGQKRPERHDAKATVREGRNVYTNVAIHLKGSYTFQPIGSKPSLTLNFDKFAPGQRFHGLDKIHLNNSVQDATFLCEKIARELFRDAGVPASRIGHARVELNGRALGFYVLVEGYNKRFLKRHFPSVKGNLYDGGSGGDITRALEVDSGEHPDDRSDLARLVAAAREKGASTRAASIEKQLDIDRFLTFAVLEVFLLHWDGYCMGPNNYRIFQDATQDRMVFLPHGMDQILGMRKSSQTSITPSWGGLVARAYLGTPEGRRRYLTRMEQVLTNHCNEARLLAKVDRLAEAIQPYAAPGLVDRFRYRALTEALKSRISQRIEEVQSQLFNLEKPLDLGPTGVARLTGWTFRPSNQGGVLGQKATNQDRQVLELQTSGTWASGAWRRKVLLETGQYELSGLAKVEGMTPGATNSGALLRISGDRETLTLSTNQTWQPLHYSFEVTGPIDVELICEFRGASGVGRFDAATLRLKHLPGAHPPAVKP